MKWSPEAENAVKKVPFFVRKRVRERVEKEARDAGRPIVTLAEVKRTQARYLTGMESEVKGYQIDTCFGASGCPNRAVAADQLAEQIEAVLSKADLITFLRREVDGPLKFHHEFRVGLADCPNACSQVQIKDVGIIGACRPRISEAECSACETCADTCRETAIRLDASGRLGDIDFNRCLACGACLRACPVGTLAADRSGFRILLGGKLGRRPRLAQELPGIYDADQVVAILREVITFYKAHSRKGKRFADLVEGFDFEGIRRRYSS